MDTLRQRSRRVEAPPCSERAEKARVDATHERDVDAARPFSPDEHVLKQVRRDRIRPGLEDQEVEKRQKTGCLQGAITIGTRGSVQPPTDGLITPALLPVLILGDDDLNGVADNSAYGAVAKGRGPEAKMINVRCCKNRL